MERKNSFLYLGFLVFAGSLLGVIFSYLTSLDFESTISSHLLKGNIYLISITLVAAFISDLLASLLLEYNENKNAIGEEKEIWFIEQKLILIVLFIFLMAIMASIFTNIDNGQKINDEVISGLQLKLYIVTVVLGIYAFCLKHAKLHPEDFIKFQKTQTQRLDNSNPDTDSEGNQL